MFFVALRKNKNPPPFTEAWRGQGCQLHTKLVLCPPREVVMDADRALWVYSRVLVSIRCPACRKSPMHLHLLWFGLNCSAVSAPKTKLEDIFWKRKLCVTNGHSLHRTRLDHVWIKEPWDAAQWWLSRPPRAIHRLHSWMFSKPGFAWCYCGCFQALASSDLLFTVCPSISVPPELLLMIN